MLPQPGVDGARERPHAAVAGACAPATRKSRISRLGKAASIVGASASKTFSSKTKALSAGWLSRKLMAGSRREKRGSADFLDSSSQFSEDPEVSVHGDPDAVESELFVEAIEEEEEPGVAQPGAQQSTQPGSQPGVQDATQRAAFAAVQGGSRASFPSQPGPAMPEDGTQTEDAEREELQGDAASEASEVAETAASDAGDGAGSEGDTFTAAAWTEPYWDSGFADGVEARDLVAADELLTALGFLHVRISEVAVTRARSQGEGLVGSGI